MLLLLFLFVILTADSVVSFEKKDEIRLIDKQRPSQSNQSRPLEPQCQCVSKKVWVDLILLVDASASTGQDGLNQIWEFTRSLLQSFTIEKTGDAYSTRLGIVTYGNKATVFQEFGEIDNSDLDAVETLPYNGDEHTNLERGLTAAEEQFNDHGSRNAWQIILVMATTLHGVTGFNPEKKAASLRKDGIIVMVYQFGDTVSTDLEQVASLNNFFAQYYGNTTDDMVQAMCDANCKCPVDYDIVYKKSTRDTPTAGCYEVAGTQANYNWATNKCGMFENGFLPFILDKEKAAFLTRQASPPRSFLLGLTYTNSCWQWSDGSLLGDYHPWKEGVANNGSLGCVFVDTDLMWNPFDCRSSAWYICETAPCDSTRYCIIKN